MKTLYSIFTFLALIVSSPAKDETVTQIQIETQPPDAAVFVDGTLQGKSPLLVSDIQPGEHLITAEKEGYLTSRSRIVISAGQRSVETLKLERESILAIVQTDPAGAEVQIDGVSRGKTPLLITDLAPGKYRLTLQVPGFKAKEVELNAPDRTPVKLSVSLNSDSARLIVNSRPAGAEVVINGIAKGSAPVTIDRITAGNVTLELKADGCAPYKQMLTLSAGQTETVTAVLKPIPASLKVVSIPDKARIYIDNQFKGETPVTIDDLEPGSYKVRAELRGHDISQRSVTLNRAEELTEEFRLTRNCGAMEITTQPAGIKVFIDGEELGTTKAADDATDQVSDPLTIDMLGIGTHKVQLSRPGYFPKEFEVTIEKNQTVTVQHVMKRMFIKNYTVRTRDATYEGMLLGHTLTGGIKIEIRPGIVKTLSAGDIISHAPIRTEGEGTE